MEDLIYIVIGVLFLFALYSFIESWKHVDRVESRYFGNNKKNKFKPDYAVPPGDILEDLLNGYNMTPASLAKQCNCREEYVTDILKAKTPITIDMAVSLGKVFGNSPDYWMKLEENYQKDLQRLKGKSSD